MSLLNNDTQVSVFVEGLDHPEGIAWGLDGYAYAGGEAGQVYRIDIEKQEVAQFADTGGFVLGMALDADHNVYACDAGNKAVMKITKGGAVSIYSTGTDDEPFRVPNYPAFDAKGNLYVCDSGDWHEDNGVIYRIRPGGEAEVWDRRPKEFPNGLCIGPDGDDIYVAMSVNPPRVDRITASSPTAVPVTARDRSRIPEDRPRRRRFRHRPQPLCVDVQTRRYLPPNTRRTGRHPRRGLRGHADCGSHQHRLLRTKPRHASRRKHRQMAHHPVRRRRNRTPAALPGSSAKTQSPLGDAPGFAATSREKSG